MDQNHKNKMIRQRESKINKKQNFDSPRESKSFCDFWFTLANQKFANQNESIRFKPCHKFWTIMLDLLGATGWDHHIKIDLLRYTFIYTWFIKDVRFTRICSVWWDIYIQTNLLAHMLLVNCIISFFWFDQKCINKITFYLHDLIEFARFDRIY